LIYPMGLHVASVLKSFKGLAPDLDKEWGTKFYFEQLAAEKKIDFQSG
jgi:hypothetical protein